MCLVPGEDSAADPIARFEYTDVIAVFGELSRSRQAGGTCADDHDVE